VVQQHPLVERYVAHFENALGKLDCPERQEIVDEIRNHIAEARSAGKPLDTILEALGSADVLARAYAVELLLNPRPDRRMKILWHFAKVAGVVAASGLTTLLVVAGLGSVAVGFGVSGLAMFAIGTLEAADIHLSGVQMNGISPVWAIVLGPVLLAIGFAGLVAVRLYLRFLVRTFRRVLPRVRTAPTVA
jgi:uncharacterized membrane protein